MTREEHIAWSKGRAISMFDDNDPEGAWGCILADFALHPETENHAGLTLPAEAMISPTVIDVNELRTHIEGLN